MYGSPKGVGVKFRVQEWGSRLSLIHGLVHCVCGGGVGQVGGCKVPLVEDEGAPKV